MTSSGSTHANDWEACASKDGLVSIGSHRLFLSVSGPQRKGGAPIVIFCTGNGDTISSYPLVQRLVSPFARALFYDRSGLGRSDAGPNPTDATTAAQELSLLLKAANIAPPYILVGHSYGGIIAREFLHLHDNDVAGMVLADAATERNPFYFKIPDPNVVAVMGNLNVAKVTGLRDASKLSPEEWKIRSEDMARSVSTQQSEASGYVPVCETIGEKKQLERQALGNRPLSVIRCNTAAEFRRLYDKGVEVGNGTEEQREAFRQLVENWDEMDKELKEGQTRLSSNYHWVHLPDCGHNVQFIRPDVVAGEVQWVLNNLAVNSNPNL